MHLSTEELTRSLPQILEAPPDQGRIEMIVVRPGEDQREVVQSAKLDPDLGVVGDNWHDRAGDRDPDQYVLSQVTFMSSRVVEAIAGSRDRWPLAGDQIYVDMDLSVDNLPPGTRLQVGEAELEVTAIPHTGCKKFATRYGPEALRFVNVGEGRDRRFRGMYAKVVQAGPFQVGDRVEKLPGAGS